MKLKNLSDKQILAGAKIWARQERVALTGVLYHLLEVERRKLFCDLKYSSITAYASNELGYSSDEAGRRISAMRLIKEFPAIAPKVASGHLTLTNMGLARSLFFQKKDYADKLGLLERLENKSKDEARAIVFEICPEMQKKPALDWEMIRDPELKELLERVKGKFAHTDPGIDLVAMLKKLCRNELATTKKEKCANCGSTYALETDHIYPKALGGSNDPENLRVLCRNCNQRSAIKHFGREKMARYTN